MADSDIIERLEKQIEGSNLALAAVAEVLHKMDSRLTKAEEEELELAQDEQAEVEKSEIIKAVAAEVVGLMKDNPTGAQWGDAGETKASSMSGTGQADDAENAVTIDSKTENVQNTIQAMMKQIEQLQKEVDDEDGKAAEERDEVSDDDEDADRFPLQNAEDDKEKEKDTAQDEDEDMEYAAIENMQKQLLNLQKSIQVKKGVKKATSDVSIQKMVEQETEKRLRKMGFSEENGLNRPQLIRYDDTFGVDGTTPISKSVDSSEDAVDQMMSMSYSELRRLQEAVESGETDGIPREFLG